MCRRAQCWSERFDRIRSSFMKYENGRVRVDEEKQVE